MWSKLCNFIGFSLSFSSIYYSWNLVLHNIGLNNRFISFQRRMTCQIKYLFHLWNSLGFSVFSISWFLFFRFWLNSVPGLQRTEIFCCFFYAVTLMDKEEKSTNFCLHLHTWFPFDSKLSNVGNFFIDYMASLAWLTKERKLILLN